MKKIIVLIISAGISGLVTACTTFTDIKQVSNDTFLITDSGFGPMICKKRGGKLDCYYLR